MKKSFVSHSPDDLKEPIQFLFKHYSPGVVLLNGDMGAGKTTFVGKVAEHFGIESEVSSPTFSIIQEYLSSSSERVIHMDLYRLKNAQEAEDIGVEDYLYSGDWCFIEWPDRLESLLPERACEIHWSLEDGKRHLTIKLP